ncbi:MAG: helix-turn-helix domain-containing protein [Arenicella sp.]
MPNKQIIADIIKTQRKNKGLSQDKIAAKANLSTRYYRSVELGEKMPSITTAFKISKALNMHYTDILEPAWEYWLKNKENDEL